MHFWGKILNGMEKFPLVLAAAALILFAISEASGQEWDSIAGDTTRQASLSFENTEDSLAIQVDPDTITIDSSSVDSSILMFPSAIDTADTVSVPSVPDSVAEEEKGSELDTIITYSADSIYFGVNQRITILERNARVDYQNMTLEAGRITVNWDDNLLIAEPIPDTIWIDTVIVHIDTLKAFNPSDSTDWETEAAETDSLGIFTESYELPDSSTVDTLNQPEDAIEDPPVKTVTDKSDTIEVHTFNADSTEFETILVRIDSTFISEIDTIIIIGHPVFAQGGDVIDGSRMTYNLKTKKGFVVQGETAYGDGYYYGDDIKRVDDKVLNVGTGYYTTCDLDTPHYHFYSKEMKLLVKDKVVARPLVIYFEKVPVAILPYAIISSKSGRHSGIIVPHYGESAGQGRFFRNLGYYIAPSNYWDVRASMSYFDRMGTLFEGNAVYRVLYRMNGSLAGSYTKMNNTLRWDLRYGHNHNLTPAATLRVNANFISDKQYYQDLSTNPVDRMNRTIRSDATLTNSHKSINGSSSLNLHYEENLDNGSWKTTLPRFSFSLAQRSFVPKGKDQEDTYWYNKIYYSARSNFTNQWNKNLITTSVIVAEPDTQYTVIDTSYQKTKASALKNSYGINTSQALFKYFNINPSVSLSQDITDESLNYRYDPETYAIVSEKEAGIFARHTFAFNVSLNSKLYGTFLTNFWSITGFRHVMSPSVSFRYQPDFSEKNWGYYQYLTDSVGIEQKFDRFAGQPLFGGTPSSKARSMGISLGNLFQMRRVIYKDEEEEVQKIDLFNLNFSTSYDLEKDSLNWGNLSSSFRAEPVRGTQIGPLNSLTLDISASHSPYATNTVGAPIDRFYFEGGNLSRGKILRLTSMNFTSRFRFSAVKKKEKKAKKKQIEFVEEFSDEWTALEDTAGIELFPAEVPEVRISDRLGSDYDFKPKNIPWDLSTSFRYSWSRFNPIQEPTRTMWLENSLNIKITQKWSLSYTNRIDLVGKEIVTSGFTFYRDMHCWEGHFTWNPTGVGQGFFVKINVKSPGLQDLKVEKRRGIGGFLGY